MSSEGMNIYSLAVWKRYIVKILRSNRNIVTGRRKIKKYLLTKHCLRLTANIIGYG